MSNTVCPRTYFPSLSFPDTIWCYYNKNNDAISSKRETRKHIITSSLLTCDPIWSFYKSVKGHLIALFDQIGSTQLKSKLAAPHTHTLNDSQTNTQTHTHIYHYHIYVSPTQRHILLKCDSYQSATHSIVLPFDATPPPPPPPYIDTHICVLNNAYQSFPLTHTHVCFHDTVNSSKVTPYWQ